MLIMNEHVKILKQYFGYEKFRDKQYEIIQAVINQERDICAIMFTGAGKSLCYQYPPIFTNKIALVITPLISLMKDQVNKLEEKNIPCCCLNSTIKNKESLKRDILKNKYRVVYLAPEYLVTQEEFVKELFDTGFLLGFFLDEVHCTSSMGNDFRPSYKKLSCLKRWCKNVLIVGLTATATMAVQEDIIKILKLKNPLIIKTTFDRPNLYLKVMQKKKDPMMDIVPLLKEDSPTIIYCQTRKLTDEITKLLKRRKITCDAYHAGMTNENRDKIQDRFCKNKISCIVATIAFGMGIDKTIRTVIHYGTPIDMESYYQEIGRAGRDGLKANCFLFYSLNDFNSNDYFVNLIKNENYRMHKMQMASVMKNYTFSTLCRRQYILHYFDEVYPKKNCGACDNCLNNSRLEKELSKETRLLLDTINKTGSNYGSNMIINILRGSANKKISVSHTRLKTYGKGKLYSEIWWKVFIRLVIGKKFLSENSIYKGHGCSLSVTDTGEAFLKGASEMVYTIPISMKQYFTNADVIEHHNSDLTNENNDIDMKISNIDPDFSLDYMAEKINEALNILKKDNYRSIDEKYNTLIKPACK